ncbi:MAG: hypothetical protein ACTHOH_17160 [Lysobacteraceae bacterium]
MDALARLSREVLWPAVAGNVLWTFFSLMLDAPLAHGGADLLALGLLAIYLCANWLRHADHRDDSARFVWFDVLHSLAICIVALAIYSRNPHFSPTAAMAMLLAILMLTHATGAATHGRSRKDRVAGFLMGMAGLIALAIPCAWNIPLAMGVTLLVWVAMLRSGRRGRGASPHPHA